MQPLGTKKVTQPLSTKKITQALRTKKITQPIGTTKNHATSWGKKCPKNPNLSHNQTSGDRHRSPWSCFTEFHHIGSLQYSKVQYNRIQYHRGSLQYSKVQFNRIQYHRGSLQYSKVQYNRMQYHR